MTLRVTVFTLCQLWLILLIRTVVWLTISGSTLNTVWRSFLNSRYLNQPFLVYVISLRFTASRLLTKLIPLSMRFSSCTSLIKLPGIWSWMCWCVLENCFCSVAIFVASILKGWWPCCCSVVKELLPSQHLISTMLRRCRSLSLRRWCAFSMDPTSNFSKVSFLLTFLSFSSS